MRTKDLKRHLARFNKCFTSSRRKVESRAWQEEQDEVYYHFSDECMQKENKLNPYYEVLSHTLFKLECDMDSRYRYGAYAMNTIMDGTINSMEDLEDDDFMYDAASNDADVYTYNLTKWLNSSTNNVYYLTRAIAEMEAKDGFQALGVAQSLCIEEVYLAIKNAIVEFLKEKETVTNWELDENGDNIAKN